MYSAVSLAKNTVRLCSKLGKGVNLMLNVLTTIKKKPQNPKSKNCSEAVKTALVLLYAMICKKALVLL